MQITNLTPFLASPSSLSATMTILSSILLAMPLGLINLALTGSKCSRTPTLAIHSTVLLASALCAILLMLIDLPVATSVSLSKALPSILLVQTIILFFRRNQTAL